MFNYESREYRNNVETFETVSDMGDCQNYGPFLGPYYSTGPNTGPNLGDPKRDHNFDNPPYGRSSSWHVGIARSHTV